MHKLASYAMARAVIVEMKRRRHAAAAEAPKADEVKLEETKADEPTPEAPKADEPNTERRRIRTTIVKAHSP